jgi:hypothetical protein
VVLEHVSYDPQANTVNRFDKLIDFILHLNHIEINNILCRQIGFRVMDTKFVPYFTNLFIGNLKITYTRQQFSMQTIMWFSFMGARLKAWGNPSVIKAVPT